MTDLIIDDVLDEAKNNFIDGNYKVAEPILSQMVLQGTRNPEIYQMLATIFYDKGQFNKAIKTFKRANAAASSGNFNLLKMITLVGNFALTSSTKSFSSGPKKLRFAYFRWKVFGQLRQIYQCSNNGSDARHLNLCRLKFYL